MVIVDDDDILVNEQVIQQELVVAIYWWKYLQSNIIAVHRPRNLVCWAGLLLAEYLRREHILNTSHMRSNRRARKIVGTAPSSGAMQFAEAIIRAHPDQ